MGYAHPGRDHARRSEEVEVFYFEEYLMKSRIHLSDDIMNKVIVSI